MRASVGDAPPPLQVGRFTAVEYVGRGAMGHVFVANDENIRRGFDHPAAVHGFADWLRVHPVPQTP